MKIKMRLLATLVACAASSCLSATPAFADVVNYSADVAQMNTNWSTTLATPLFDPALGTLQSITFTLTGNVGGSVSVESTDSNPSTITSALSAKITLTRPDSTVIVITTPAAVYVDNFTAFDGTVDFGGTSGATHDMISNSLTATVISTSAADFALFTGVGSLSLPISALATSSASGAGNIVTTFATLADAKLSLAYTYAPRADTGVPEPASLSLLGIGALASVGAMRRRR